MGGYSITLTDTAKADLKKIHKSGDIKSPKRKKESKFPDILPPSFYKMKISRILFSIPNLIKK